MGGATGWVKERRGRVPVGRAEARKWLQDTRKQLQDHRSRCVQVASLIHASESGILYSGSDEMHMIAMDAAMLELWLKHSR